jgi:hypothetical protein
VVKVLGCSLALLVLVGACSGSSTPAAPTSATSTSGGGPATTTPPASGAGGPGTITVTIGSASKTYPITFCSNPSGNLDVEAGDQRENGVQIVLPAAAGDTPSLAGFLDGREWVVGKGTFTRSGNDGTFGGSILGSKDTVLGSFHCASIQ